MLTQKSRKIIIAGDARAGTALLVELLTELGLDTGCVPRSRQNDSRDHLPVSTDRDLEAVSAPYIVHNSKLAAELPAILARGHVTIDYALIPIRQLDESQSDANRFTEHFHTLVETLAAHDIPNTFLHFPRFAHDANYTFARLRPLLGEMTRAEFTECFTRVAKPDVVRAIIEGRPLDAAPGEASRHSHRSSSQFARRSLQAAAACALVSLGWAAANWSTDKKIAGAPASIVREPHPGAAMDHPPHRPAFPLPSFRSLPLRVSESLTLASIEIYPDRSFPSRFGPMNLWNRPPSPIGGPAFRREALNEFFRHE